MSLAPDVVSILSALVAIPSVNPSIAPGEGTGEAAIAAYIQSWFVANGVRARLEEAAPGRPNVVAEVGRSDDPTLVLCAHLDTVGSEGMTIEPFHAVIDGDRLYGRGAYDMKGSVAAIMVAMAQLASTLKRGRVVAALVADEEYASLGAFDFVRRHRASACIVTEPAESGLVLAHKGFVWLDVTTTGRAAHGSRWDVGVSAIARMGPIITALDAFDRTVLRARTHPLVGAASMHCALVTGGMGLSTYAPSCRVQIERRTLPGETAEQVGDEIAALVRSIDETARVEVTFSRDASVCEADAPIAACVGAAIAAITGTTPEHTGVGFWMDAAVFSAAGIPTVNYGPTGEGAHAAIEWVDIPSVLRLTEVLTESCRRFTRS